MLDSDLPYQSTIYHRAIEGKRHLLVPKRMTSDLGPYSVSEPEISPLSDYPYDSAFARDDREMGGILAGLHALHGSGPLQTIAM